MNRRLFGTLALALLSMGSFCQAEKPAELNKVRLKTNKGDIVIQLDAVKAPVTVENFKKYVEAGHYNGTVFHRVIADFMIQGGGFAKQGEKLVEKKTREEIVNEGQNGLKNEVGTIAMARMRDPNSATAQFFINVAKNDNLDFPSNGGYAVFGKVIEGMDVVNAIRVVKTSTQNLVSMHPKTGELIPSPSEDVPDELIIIEKATLE